MCCYGIRSHTLLFFSTNRSNKSKSTSKSKSIIIINSIRSARVRVITRGDLPLTIVVREIITNHKEGSNSTASLIMNGNADSLIIHSITCSNGKYLKDRTKKGKARRHKVKMKKKKKFSQFHSLKLKSAINLFVRRKSVVGLINPRLISWALLVCVLFIVSSIQLNCDITSQQEKRQDREFTNKRYSVDRSARIRLFTGDTGVSRTESFGDTFDWFGDESAQSVSNQRLPLNSRAHFRENQARRVVASRWQTEVFLPCQIENLDEEQTVSWIRKRDSLVLTIDKLKLIDDPRFQLAQSNQNWTLVLSQPTSQDAGFYECQVSSMEPKLSRVIELRMVDANSRISNFTSLFVRPNETLNVTCLIEAPHETDFVYWYKNKDPIQFDNLKLRRAASKQSSEGGNPFSGRRVGSKKPKNTFITVASSPYKQTDPKTSPLTSNSPEEPNLNENAKKSRESEQLDENELENGPNYNKMNEYKQGEDTEVEEVEEKGKKDSASNPNESQDEPLLKSSSFLIIKQTQLNDTANYTCLPSNAKPSHISIYVIENGSQSQPEKRSLLVVDGAYSNRYLLSDNWLLIKQIVFKLATHINIQTYIFPSVIDVNMNGNEQSIASLSTELLSNQDFHRLIITLFISIYLGVNLNVNQNLLNDS